MIALSPLDSRLAAVITSPLLLAEHSVVRGTIALSPLDSRLAAVITSPLLLAEHSVVRGISFGRSRGS